MKVEKKTKILLYYYYYYYYYYVIVINIISLERNFCGGSSEEKCSEMVTSYIKKKKGD